MGQVTELSLQNGVLARGGPPGEKVGAPGRSSDPIGFALDKVGL